MIAPARAPIVAPARSARELIDAAGVVTFLEDRQLEVAMLDQDAMERWYARPPGSVYVYAEQPIEVAKPGVTRRLRCQSVQRWDNNVLNQLAVVVWQEGRARTVLELGQADVHVVDQTRERGGWETVGAQDLPMQAIAWDDAHVRYAEGAEIHELACVPELRTVSCGACVDLELVVRPWRVPTVPHVGPVIPAYSDPYPEVPEGGCPVRCEPSACGEALRIAHLPRSPLYAEDAPVLAAFRSQAACRAFASARGKHRPASQ